MLNHNKLRYSLDFNSSLAYSASGVYTSAWMDTESQGLTVLWDEYVATQVVPTDASITHEVRANNDKSETAWGTSLASASGRYVQFRSTLGKKESGSAPALQKMELKPNAKGQENTTNLARGGGMEGWTNGVPDNWLKGSAVTVSQVTGYNGIGYAVRFSSTDNQWNSNSVLRTDTPSIYTFVSGTTYTLSLKVRRVIGTTGALRVSIANIGNPIVTSTDSTGSWVTISATFTSTISAGRAIEIWSDTVANVWDIDEVQLEERKFASEYTEGSRLAKTIMIEEGSTNLWLYSQEFDNVYWNKTRSTITANATTAPDGTLSADKLVTDTATGGHYVYRSGAATSGQMYTFSVFAKKAEYDYLTLAGNGSSGNDLVWFNLNTGIIATKNSNITQASMTPVGNGWYRCSATINPITGTNPSIGTSNADAVTNITGDGTSGIYIWGAQLEQKAYATSYIPTTSASVTRSGDELLLPAGSLRPDAGTIIMRVYVDPYLLTGGSVTLPRGFMLFSATDSQTTANNRVALMINTGSKLRMQFANGAGTVTDVAEGLITLTSGWHTIGLRWSATEASIYVDGVQKLTAANPNIPSASPARAVVGGSSSNLFGPLHYNYPIDSFYIFREYLSNTDMATYTMPS